ncbi:S24 family peptidase [Sphingomonas sanxanigenens]|nr:S24 family peptidase [Sphingomonas sanxanigenens]
MTSEATIEILRARLSKAIEFRNVTPKALAKTAGVGETVVRDIIQGMTKDVRLSTVERLAKALDLSVADLLPDAFKTARPSGEEPDQPPLLSASRDDGAVAIRQVDLAYAMGTGKELEDFPDELPVLFDPGFLRTLTRAPADRLYVARGDGDSMFPTLINGDQVMIDTTQRYLNMQDRIWAISIYGASMIKRLRTVGPGRVRVLSDNTAIPPEDVDAEDLFIAGRVIWIGRKV